MKQKLVYFVFSFVFLSAVLLQPVRAQETTGKVGSPGATTTIDGKQLPPPDPKFGGVIKDDALKFNTMVAAKNRSAQKSTKHFTYYDR